MLAPSHPPDVLQLAYIVSHGDPVAVPCTAVQVGSHHIQPTAFPEAVGSMLSSFSKQLMPIQANLIIFLPKRATVLGNLKLPVQDQKTHLCAWRSLHKV